MADSSGHDDFEFYRYDPSVAAAVIFLLLFLVMAVFHTYQMFRTKTWYFIPFVIGGFFEWIGYIGRIMGGNETPDWTLGPYILQTILILIAPALFAASIYMVLGRIILLTDGETHSLIRRRWLTKIFVCGDVISFLMQGGGGGVMASGSAGSLKTGEKIVIGGLVVQIVFFSVFVAVGMTFHYRMRLLPTSKVTGEGIPWEAHMKTLYVGSILILVRSVFRLVEYAQGNDGYLVSHEVFLYVFDSLLMLATMVAFAWKHPSEVNAMLKGRGGKAVKNFFVVYPVYFSGDARDACEGA